MQSFHGTEGGCVYRRILHKRIDRAKRAFARFFGCFDWVCGCPHRPQGSADSHNSPAKLAVSVDWRSNSNAKWRSLFQSWTGVAIPSNARLTHAHAQATFFIQMLYLLAKIRKMLNLSQEQALCKKYNGYFASYISLIFCSVCVTRTLDRVSHFIV